MTGTAAGPWADRVEAIDWATVGSELDDYGCALTGPLLTADEAAEIAALYTDISRFRSTIDMRRYRFGEGGPHRLSGLALAALPLFAHRRRRQRTSRPPAPRLAGETSAAR